jgi:ferredoxin-NADP reductase
MPGDLVLIYRAVSEDDLIFRRELDELALKRGFTIHYVLGDHRLPENGHLMSVPHLRQMVPDLARREAYLCGPPAMIRSLERNVRRAGVPNEHIHIDKFDI